MGDVLTGKGEISPRCALRLSLEGGVVRRGKGVRVHWESAKEHKVNWETVGKQQGE